MAIHKDSVLPERLEIVEVGRRRRWSETEKLRIVMESLEAPRLISATARRHGISRSLLTTWRRALKVEPVGAAPAAFVPAVVVPEAPKAMPEGAPRGGPLVGRMAIELGRDRRIVVDAGVDADALSRVLDVLERR